MLSFPWAKNEPYNAMKTKDTPTVNRATPMPPVARFSLKTPMAAIAGLIFTAAPCHAAESAPETRNEQATATQQSETGAISYVTIQKRRAYSQSSMADPTADPDSPFLLTSYVQASQPGFLMPTTTMDPPSGATGRMLYEHGSHGLMVHAIFRTEAALDAAYPAGDYQIRVETTTGGTHPVDLALGASAYPGIPKITGATNAAWQGDVLKVTNRNQDVVLQWSNPGNHNTRFWIDDTGVHSQNNNPSTGFTIPAGALEDNQLYRASVQFMNVSGSSSANAGYATDLHFLIEVGTPVGEEGDFYLLLKSHSQVQISNDGPADVPILLFDSDREPYSMTAESPVGGVLAGPQDTSFPLAFRADGDGPGYEYLSTPEPTAAALNATHPNGTYTFPGEVAVSLDGDLYPEIATILTVNGAPPVWNAQGQLALNPDVENTITWSNVVVPDFETTGYQMVEFWNNNDFNFDGLEEERGAPAEIQTPMTSLTIPAESMTRTFTYNGIVEYAKITTFEENEELGAAAAAGYFSEVRFMAVALNPQTINFPEIAAMSYPSSPFTLVADASSELPVDFDVVSGPAEIVDGELTVTGEGTVTVRASQRGNATFASAAPVTQSFEVEAAEGSLLDIFRAAYGLATDGSEDALSPAGDGVPNLLKFAFNMIGENEGQAASLTTPNRSILALDGNAGLPRMDIIGGRLSLTYVRIKSDVSPGIQYTVEFSNTLKSTSWQTNADAEEAVSAIDANLERVTVTDHQTFGKRFGRVRVAAD